MKTAAINRRMSFKYLTIVFLIALSMTEALSAQDWYDNDWQYRCPVTVQGLTTAQTDFQVRIVLNSGNFDFTRAGDDGSDIRVTASDGTTLLPFWIENWATSPTRSDTLWVKVPTLPTDGLTVYIYYGNAAPTVPPQVPVETPPSGPFTKNPNKIYPIGTPPGMTYLVAENIVKDDAPGGHYWLAFTESTNFDHYDVHLAWSDDPTNPGAWNWYYTDPDNINEPVIANASSPHLMEHEGTWYIFYGDHSTLDIAVATATSPGGPYTYQKQVLQKGNAGTWEDYRVLEPCVFWHPTMGKWIMMYMGDAGGVMEQIGYATADDILAGTGLYQKYTGNPCIRFGPEGTYDAGTVADPWVYNFYGVYYIGYAVSSTNTAPWQTALATTTDWQTFTKHGILLPLGGEYLSLRGDVIRIGDQYVFSYTGGTGPSPVDAELSLATQPVYQILPNPVNDGNAVFDFFDGFSGTSVDAGKWEFVQGNTGMTSVGSGLLTMTATTTSPVQILGLESWGTDYVGETRARHPDQGTSNVIMEVGFADKNWNTVRLLDDLGTSTSNWLGQAIRTTDPRGVVIPLAPTADKEWHVFHVYRQGTGTAGFQIDNLPIQTFSPATVPTMILPPFLMSFASGTGTNSNFIVDWTRVRKWAGSDPVTVAGSEESLITQWTGTESGDWATAGNWTSGVPSSWNNITIPAATNSPLLNGSLTIGSTASLTLDPGGALTVTGDLTVIGPVTISSSLASSGSLIVTGNSTGNITYNRQLKAGPDSGSDWHLAAPPVATNSNGNTGRVSTLYQWSEPTGTWTTTAITSAVAGRGYNVRQETASDGSISFAGPIVNSDLTVAASSPFADAVGPDENYFDRTYVSGRSLENPGGRGWNLLGNPYPSAILAEDFIAANYSSSPGLSQFDLNHVAVYLFDGTSQSYYYLARSTGWPSGTNLSETHIQAGQGFFVMAMDDDSEFQFTRAMQEHSTITPMLKSGNTDDCWPGFQLKAKHISGEVVMTVVYNGSMTTGIDPGYDIGLFKSGQEMEIYSLLALRDNGINYTRQALPVSGSDTLSIPVGIDIKDGGEVTFSATTVSVDGRRFWFEDRTAGIFTDLSLKSYTVNLPTDTYGTGRFFIIASANAPTAIRHPDAPEGDLRIWVSGRRIIIQGEVGKGSLCGLFDIQGRKLLEYYLTDGERNAVDLPAGLQGLVMVRVTDGLKTVTTKLSVL